MNFDLFLKCSLSEYHRFIVITQLTTLCGVQCDSGGRDGTSGSSDGRVERSEKRWRGWTSACHLAQGHIVIHTYTKDCNSYLHTREHSWDGYVRYIKVII
jgi:hypothetical protein